MMRGEWLARVLVLVVVVGIPLVLLVGGRSQDGVEIRGVTPSPVRPGEGGWSIRSLRVEAGVPLKLRLTSDDVVHGFAIGRQEGGEVDVQPGRFTQITLTFDWPGIYTYYCTRWCGLAHWWMRGTIVVTEGGQPPGFDPPPLYETLGLDLDADHTVDVKLDAPPSAHLGAALTSLFSPTYLTKETYVTRSPDDVWKKLRAERAGAGLDDGQLWNLVAFAWRSHATAEQREQGRTLYAANCATCHGSSGAGDGVFADKLWIDAGAPASLSRKPAAFTDATKMLGASSALLDGKIRRGGMGTAMPAFATILTDQQIEALVAYLWTFPFQE